MKDELLDIADELDGIRNNLYNMDSEDAETELPSVAAEISSLSEQIILIANRLTAEG